MTDKYRFVKDMDTLYIPYKNGEQIFGKGIHIHYNWYSRSNYYEVDGINFKHLNDAKAYIKENY